MLEGWVKAFKDWIRLMERGEAKRFHLTLGLAFTPKSQRHNFLGLMSAWEAGAGTSERPNAAMMPKWEEDMAEVRKDRHIDHRRHSYHYVVKRSSGSEGVNFAKTYVKAAAPAGQRRRSEEKSMAGTSKTGESEAEGSGSAGPSASEEEGRFSVCPYGNKTCGKCRKMGTSGCRLLTLPPARRPLLLTHSAGHQERPSGEAAAGRGPRRISSASQRRGARSQA